MARFLRQALFSVRERSLALLDASPKCPGVVWRKSNGGRSAYPPPVEAVGLVPPGFASSVTSQITGAVILALLLLMAGPRPQTAMAQGSTPLLDPPLSGCYDVAVYGVGLFADGEGALVVAPPDGAIVAAYLEWVGAEDTTPGGMTLDGTSTLLVNGRPVAGTLAAPFDPNGNAGYDPNGYVDRGPAGWFSWHADLGPTGLGLIPAQLDADLPIQISGWDSPARQTNGASLTIIHRRPCGALRNEIQFLTGVNWYHYRTPDHALSQLLIYPVDPEPVDRVVRLVFSHAGTDRAQTTCRGGAIWMLADDGAQPMPVPDAFDLAAYGDNNGDGQPHGYGINGGVEILNDPFTSAALPCTPALNPPPDEAYAPGHPYPGGARSAPYQAVAMLPPSGGDVGMGGEWGVVSVDVRLPARARWIAFQLESEADQNGESGSWVGGGVFQLLPSGSIGDYVWHDRNGDGIQNDGMVGINGVRVQLESAGPDNVFGSADDRTAETVTGDGASGPGDYRFADQPAGLYRVRFDLPTGYRFTAPQQANHSIDSDADPASGQTAAFVLMPGEINLNLDAGLVRLASAIDIEKAPEQQVIAPQATARFTITVVNTGALDLMDVVVSDEAVPACGRSLGDLPVGATVRYTCVRPLTERDFINTAAVDGVDGFGEHVHDEDRAAVDVTPLIAVEKLADPSVLSQETGLVTFAVRVVNQVAEPLTLRLLQDDQFGDLNGRGDCATPQTLAVGGEYRCRFQALVTPGGAGHRNEVTAVAHDDEGNEAIASDDATVVVVAPARSSSLGDFVWQDTNADGLQDSDEAGVAGVLISLYRADDSLAAQTTTDVRGIYGFTGLEAGDYYLVFAATDALGRFNAFSQPDQGEDDRVDSDVLGQAGGGLSGRTARFTLLEGVADTSRDAGLLVPTAEEPDQEPRPVERIYLPLAQ